MEKPSDFGSDVVSVSYFKDTNYYPGGLELEPLIWLRNNCRNFVHYRWFRLTDGVNGPFVSIHMLDEEMATVFKIKFPSDTSIRA